MSLPNFDPKSMMGHAFHPHLASATHLAEVKVAWQMLYEIRSREADQALESTNEAEKLVTLYSTEYAERLDLEEDLTRLVKIAPKLEGLVVITGLTCEEIAEKRTAAVAALNVASKIYCKAAQRSSWARDELKICDAFIAYMQKANTQDDRLAAIFKSWGLYPVHDRMRDRDARLAYWKALL